MSRSIGLASAADGPNSTGRSARQDTRVVPLRAAAWSHGREIDPAQHRTRPPLNLSNLPWTQLRGNSDNRRPDTGNRRRVDGS